MTVFVKPRQRRIGIPKTHLSTPTSVSETLTEHLFNYLMNFFLKYNIQVVCNMGMFCVMHTYIYAFISLYSDKYKKQNYLMCIRINNLTVWHVWATRLKILVLSLSCIIFLTYNTKLNLSRVLRAGLIHVGRCAVNKRTSPWTYQCWNAVRCNVIHCVN